MRCARCGHDNAPEADVCAQCGKLLASAPAITGEQPLPSAATPVWQRPKAAKPVEAPPWAGTDNAAPWQTPPEFGVPGRSRRTGDGEEAGTSGNGVVRPDKRGPDKTGPDKTGPDKTGPDKTAQDEPRRSRRTRSAERAGRADPAGRERPRPDGGTLAAGWSSVAAGVGMLVYAAYAAGPRRGMFVTLDTDPASVTAAAAERSDLVNGALFAVAAVLVVGAVGASIGWLRRHRHRRVAIGALDPSSAPRRPPTGPLVVAGSGVLALAAAMVVQAGGDPARIALGYLVLGAGAAALSAASAWSAVTVFRSRS